MVSLINNCLLPHQHRLQQDPTNKKIHEKLDLNTSQPSIYTTKRLGDTCRSQKEYIFPLKISCSSGCPPVQLGGIPLFGDGHVSILNESGQDTTKLSSINQSSPLIFKSFSIFQTAFVSVGFSGKNPSSSIF